ncbi:MAG TPA: fluoride efflux transporter CrcB [Solirubrobacteraceae bacterium]|nr:fluoride efflux transporter CrcB [Solirubrobacteraceae bacterium]
MSDWVWLAVAAVGGAGAIARFLLDSLIAERAGRDFPYGTFAINVSGALVLGILAGLAIEGNLMVIAGTATIGSYTTFSTWMLETHRLAEDRELQRSTLNTALSLLAGFAAALVGHTIGAHA